MKKNWMPIALILGALLTRFMFIGWPPEAVFDEVHYGKFVNGYLKGEFWFSGHPPLAVQAISLGAWLGKYKPHFAFENIGEKFGDRSYIWLRFMPNLAGSLIPFAAYLFLRALGVGVAAAFFVGTLLIFENGLLVQSHFILVDAFLVLFGFLGLACFFVSRRKGYTLPFLVLAGSLFALAGAVKWSGFGFLLFAGMAALKDFVFRDPKLILKHPKDPKKSLFSLKQFVKIGLALGFVPFLVYFGVFYLHFRLLPKSGPGDVFMSQEFRDGKKNALAKFIELNATNYGSNIEGLTATHPYGSKFYAWPAMTRPVYYWVKDLPNQKTARIYLLGNPVIWWLSSLGVILGFFLWRPKLREGRDVKLLLYLGYLLNLLPFAGISRVLFLYHYLPSLVFAVAISSLWFLDYLERQKEVSRRKTIIAGVLLVVIAAFLFFAPLSYGLPLSAASYKLRVWLPSWM